MKTSSWVTMKGFKLRVWTVAASLVVISVSGLNGAEKKPSTLTPIQPIRTLTSPWFTKPTREVISIHPVPYTENLLVLSNGQRPSIQIIDGKTLAERGAIPIPDTIECIQSLTPYPDEKRFLAVVSRSDRRGDQLMELTVPDGTFKLVQKLKHDVRAVTVHAGKQFVACEGNRALVYDRRTHSQVAALERPFDGKSVEEIQARRRLEKGERLTKGMLHELSFTVIYGCKDGTRCITLHTLGALECWDVATGKRVWGRGGKSDPHYVYDKNPVDDSILVTNNGGDLVCIDSATGKEIWRLELASAVECARWTPDGRSIAAVVGKRLYLISREGKRRGSTPLCEYGWLFLEWSANGDRIYLVIDGLISSYDKDLKPLHPNVEVQPFDDEIKGMTVAANGNILVYTETQIGYFKRNKHKLTRVWGHEAESISNVAVSPNGKFVAILQALFEDDDHVAILECETGKPIQRIGTIGVFVPYMSFSSQSQYFYFARQRYADYGADGSMVVEKMKVVSGEIVSEYCHPSESSTKNNDLAIPSDEFGLEGEGFDLGGFHAMSNFVIEPGGHMMAAVGDGSDLIIWDLDRDGFSKVLCPAVRTTQAVFLRHNENSRQLAVLSSDNGDYVNLRISDYGVSNPVPLSSKSLTKTIKQLGDSSYKIRETATRRLVKGGLNAVFGLPKAPLPDPEVQARLQSIQGEVLKNLEVANVTDYVIKKYSDIVPVPQKSRLWMGQRYFPYDRKIFELVELKGGKIRVLKRFQNLARDGGQRLLSSFGPDGLFYVCNDDGSISVFDVGDHAPKKLDALSLNTEPKRSGEVPRNDAAASKSVPISLP